MAGNGLMATPSRGGDKFTVLKPFRVDIRVDSKLLTPKVKKGKPFRI
jgi:hypothetical protein